MKAAVLRFDPNRPRARRQPQPEHQTRLETASARLAALQTLNPYAFDLALTAINESYRLATARTGGAR